VPTGQEKTRAQKHQSTTWAQRLKRVLSSILKPVSSAVVRGYSEHQQIGRKADLHIESCPKS
jgi:hypothetical protein